MKITDLGFDRTISRYNLGSIVDQFNDNQTSYELSGRISNGPLNNIAGIQKFQFLVQTYKSF